MSECEATETTEKPWSVDDYISFYAAIPEEKWTTGDFVDGFGRCCALGHLGFRNCTESPVMHSEFFRRYHVQLPMVNDGFVEPYNHQPTPKQRVLAYLRDLKSKEAAK